MWSSFFYLLYQWNCIVNKPLFDQSFNYNNLHKLVRTIKILSRFFIHFSSFHLTRIQVLIDAEQTAGRLADMFAPLLFAHKCFVRRNGFSPLGEKERDFHVSRSIGDRLQPRRLNAALCLRERRELRLPSVNMSARRYFILGGGGGGSDGGGGTPLSRYFCACYIALGHFYASHLA